MKRVRNSESHGLGNIYGNSGIVPRDGKSGHGRCAAVPIINLNAIVESLWSTLKKRYLRKHSRAKLEFLVDIIMNQYLPNLTMLITAHHKGEKGLFGIYLCVF